MLARRWSETASTSVGPTSILVPVLGSHNLPKVKNFLAGGAAGIPRSAKNVPLVLGKGTTLFVGLAAVWLCDCACLCACVRACLASERLRQRTSRRGASVIANTEYSARPRADGAWLSRCELRRRRQLRPCGRHLWQNTEEERKERHVPRPTTSIFLFRFHSSSSADVETLAFLYLLTRFRCSLFEFPTVRDSDERRLCRQSPTVVPFRFSLFFGLAGRPEAATSAAGGSAPLLDRRSTQHPPDGWKDDSAVLRSSDAAEDGSTCGA